MPQSLDQAFDVAPPLAPEGESARKGHRRRRLGSLLRCQDGASVVEFVLIAPLLAIGFLILGFMAVGVQRYMDVEQVLRAGARAAALDSGQAGVFDAMRIAAQAKGIVVWEGGLPVPDDRLALWAARNCACPENLSVTQSDCRPVCSNGRPPVVRYAMSAFFPARFDSRFQRGLTRLGVPLPSNWPTLTKQVVVR
jgi:hypothetical protein